MSQLANKKKSTIKETKLLAAIFDSSPLGLHVLESIRNAEGEIVDFYISMTNAASEKIAGRKVAGLRMLEGWPHTKEIGLFEKFISVVENGQQLDFEFLYEGEGVRAWFRWLAYKFRDGLYVTIEDISSRKKIEEELSENVSLLNSTLSGVPALIALLDVKRDSDESTDFIIRHANKALADFSGYLEQDLIGKSMVKLYPNVFRGEVTHKFTDVFITGEPNDFEYFYENINRWFSVFTTKQLSGKGLVVAAIDITEKKKREDERRQIQVLTEMDRLKSEFFSNVSHEFRTPLTLLLGPLRELIASNRTPKAHLKWLEMIERNTLRLQKLVNSVLDFYRMESGKAQVIYQPTDIAAFTTLICGNFRSAIENANLKFHVSCQSLEPVYINRDMWEKILLNLLSNALKFTLQGSIEVNLKALKRHFQLSVSDSGIGIASDDIDKVFKRFVRIENGKARTNEGSGIGLSLVKEFVSLHFGTIKLYSKVDKGTEVVITLPRGKSHLAPKSIYHHQEYFQSADAVLPYSIEASTWKKRASDEIGSFQLAQNKPTVLIADDNSDMREYLRMVLCDDYNLVMVPNGRAATAVLEGQTDIAIVISDIMMPIMDGVELLTLVKSRYPTLPFIMLSAKATEADRLNALRMGADAYVVKPFSAVELKTLMEESLRRAAIGKSQENSKDSFFAEIKLRDSIIKDQRQLLYTALDAFDELAIIVNSAGKIDFTNLSWSRYTGLSAEKSLDPMIVESTLQLSGEFQNTQLNVGMMNHCAIRNRSGEFNFYSMKEIPLGDANHQTLSWLRIFTPTRNKKLSPIKAKRRRIKQ